MNDGPERDPRLLAIPDTHGHAKGEHKPYLEERPLPLTARMLFLWFYHACRRGYPRFLMVADHMNYLTFEDPAAVNLVRRALKLAQAGDLYGAAETANIDVAHAAVVSEGLRRGMRYSIGAEVDNDPRSRPDASNIVDAMRPDAIIRSVHFVQITHPVHGEGWHWPFDNPEFRDLFDVVGTEQTWELYVTALVDAIERLPGHIVGHFFVPAVFGHWPDDAKLSAYEDRVLDAAAARQMAVEFNTRFFYRDHTDEEKQRYLSANKRFLRKAKARGVGIAIGSDAHSPKDQGGAFETVLAVLDELDINEIVFPLGGSLRRVALRVERKPEPEPPAAPHEPVRPSATAGGEAGKTVRKARASAKPSRAPETSPDRPHERPEVSPSADAGAPPPTGRRPGVTPAAEPPAPRSDVPPPGRRVKPKPDAANRDVPASDGAAAAKSAPTAAKPVAAGPSRTAKPPAAPKAPAVAKPLAAKAAPAAKAPLKAPAKAPAAKAPSKPGKPGALRPGPVKTAVGKAGAAKAAPKRTPSAPVKTKVGAGKPDPRGTKAAPARGVAAKNGPAKGAAKKSGSKAPAHKAPAHKAATHKAPAKKAPAPKKPAAKKPAPARPSAKKPAPKKTIAKRPAPARKAAPAKKTTAKKSATKRR